MIIENIKNIEGKLGDFKEYDSVVIIGRYDSGKSSIATELIHKYFGEENTYYITFIDQSKANFIPRKSRLKFNEIVKDKVIVFDEIDDEGGRDIRGYVKKLIKDNLVIILSNPYASSNNAGKEISLFKETEKDILPNNVLFIFVKDKNAKNKVFLKLFKCFLMHFR
ncbi:MAG: GTPase domain-containing protein [Nanoarchaeota archaeon]|nr:GTPase domain-containing protein [Nanoarchaeota archaeon]